MDHPAEQPVDDQPPTDPSHTGASTTGSDECSALIHSLGNELTMVQMGITGLLRRGLIAEDGKETGVDVLEAAERALGLFRELRDGPAERPPQL